MTRYPGVRPSKARQGMWEARRPSNGKQTYLGTYDTPEAARYAVCLAQAEDFEARAEVYRAEAELLAELLQQRADQ